MNLRLVTSSLHDSRLAIGLGSAALALSILLAAPVLAQDEPTTVDPQVVIETSKGDIVVELFAQEAPKSTANFLEYVDAGFYDGTIFHRVIPSFMIQGGGFSSDMKRKETRRAITNEADNGLRNERGTLAMARTGDPHSATAQFYVNTVDNRPLDHTAKTPRGWGYAVFGKVVSGMDVVDSISNVRTKSFGGMRDVPVEPITIVKAYRKPAQESAD